MTNIYNKIILGKNGTLVGNWFEEDVLRTKTGEGRTIPGKHINKKAMDFDVQITNEHPYNDTRARTMGKSLGDYYYTTNKNYGNFSNEHEKYKNKGIREKIFTNFINNFQNQNKDEENKIKEKISNLRLHETNCKNMFNTKPCDYVNLGKRHMFNQDNIPLNPENDDKDFKASHDMGKFPKVISNNQSDNYIDKNIPYYKDKEVTYWSTNLNKGNMYKSASNSNNAFAKTSGLTQTVHNTKSANQFNGNITNNNKAQSIVLDDHDNQFSQEYLTNLNNSKVKEITLTF